MPCGDSTGQDYWWELEYGTNDPDKLRDMLCTLMKTINECYQRGDNPFHFIQKDTNEWYKKHKKWDEFMNKLDKNEINEE